MCEWFVQACLHRLWPSLMPYVTQHVVWSCRKKNWAASQCGTACTCSDRDAVAMEQVEEGVCRRWPMELVYQPLYWLLTCKECVSTFMFSSVAMHLQPFNPSTSPLEQDKPDRSTVFQLQVITDRWRSCERWGAVRHPWPCVPSFRWPQFCLSPSQSPKPPLCCPPDWLYPQCMVGKNNQQLQQDNPLMQLVLWSWPINLWTQTHL